MQTVSFVDEKSPQYTIDVASQDQEIWGSLQKRCLCDAGGSLFLIRAGLFKVYTKNYLNHKIFIFVCINMLILMLDILQTFFLYAWIPHCNNRIAFFVKKIDSRCYEIHIWESILVSNDKLYSLFLFFNDNKYQGFQSLISLETRNWRFQNRLTMMKT